MMIITRIIMIDIKIITTNISAIMVIKKHGPTTSNEAEIEL